MFTGCVAPSPELLVVGGVVCVTGLPVVSDTAKTVVDGGDVVVVDIVVGVVVDIVVTLAVWEIVWVVGDVVCGGSEVVETEGDGEEVIIESVVGAFVPVVMRNRL